MSKMGRREFLMGSMALLDIMCSGFVSKAMAQAMGVNPRKYLFIPLMGGPSRWTFTPLSPDPNDLGKIIRNPMVNTKFTSATGMEYRTTPTDGLAMPWLWQFNVARAGGGMRAMKELMGNMMIIRGVNARSDHGGQVDRYFPTAIPYTMSSLTGDKSPASIPAITVKSGGEGEIGPFHVSRLGKAAVTLPPNGNHLQMLMDGLTLTPRKYYSLSEGSVKAVMDSVATKLENIAVADSSGFEVSAQSLKSAKETMARGFGDLSSVYTTLVNKYIDICQRTVSQTLPGINDIPIGIAPANRGREYNAGYFDDKYPNQFISRNADMRTIINSNSRAGNLAQHFALAEFALTNGLSDSIILGVNNYGGLSFQLDGGPWGYAKFDEHELGSIPTLLISSFSHLTFGACLLELIDRLKAKNLFAETLIDLSGEMGRNPRVNVGGSDHGGQALDVAMWCGAFDPAGPKVIGDVMAAPPASYRYVDSGTDLYPGSWGYGASNPNVGIITHGHVAATQARILRVDNPVRSVSSLVTETNGVVKSLLPLGRTR
jgi:hypothetical protein